MTHGVLHSFPIDFLSSEIVDLKKDGNQLRLGLLKPKVGYCKNHTGKRSNLDKHELRERIRGHKCQKVSRKAKTGYLMIERIQGQRSNPRGVCEEDLEASSPAINKRLLSLTKRHRGVILI
ncbi:hypothetical protein Tco_1149185 [Tanacetum coccineum]